MDYDEWDCDCFHGETDEEFELHRKLLLECDENQLLFEALTTIISDRARTQCSDSERQEILKRHYRGDWGDSPDDWVAANEKALRFGRLIVSVR